MARQTHTAQMMVLRSRKPVVRRVPLALLSIAVFLTCTPISRAESLAAKNKKGNRFFAQGKYEDAEKVYLDAEVNNPGKPEILYNLGNSLIKQKKYDQGIQTLRQSIRTGDKSTQENSWYNTGDALFSLGNYKDSAEAFVQALKMDPADRDAKHNLELALMKLKEQQQKQSGKDRNPPKTDSSKQDQRSSEEQREKGQQGQNSPGNQKEQREPGKEYKSGDLRNEGSMTKDQALRMLDAVKNREIEEQRMLLEHRASQKTNVKDW